MHHPVVGDLELTGEALVLPGDTGLTIITYTVEPFSPSAEALNFFASWASGNARADTSPHSPDSMMRNKH
jgi:transcription regulator MmyB-like protein